MSAQLLTGDETAQELRITIAVLRRRRREGRIEAINVGTPRNPIWRYERRAIDAFKRANTHKAKAASAA